MRVLAIVAILLALATGWLAFRMVTVRQSLLAAQDKVAALRTKIADGAQPSDQRRALGEVAAKVDRAHSAVHDPVWTVASAVPVLGQPLRTIRGLADVSHRLAKDAMPALVAATGELSAARSGPTAGAIPLDPLRRSLDPLQKAGSSISAERQRVVRLPGSWLAPAASARESLLGSLTDFDTQVTHLTTAVRLAPELLGSGGTRRYFVAFENPAEARGSGGLIGGFAVLEATNGKLTVPRLGTDAELPVLKSPPPGLDKEWVANYGELDVATEWRNTNASPHFPYTGAAWAAMYRQLTGVQVDGALSLDPVALGVLLEGAGPVVLPGIATVAAGNVVDFIERDEYALPLTTAQRKSILTSLGKAAVDRLLKGSAPGPALVRGLSDAAYDGHLEFMSLRQDEQSQLSPFPIAGVLERTAAPFAQAVVNNAAGNKLDYYLRSALDYRVEACDISARKVTLTMRLLNEAPTAALPAYASGRVDNPPYAVGPNQHRVLLSLFLTEGARFVSATIDGRAIGLQPGRALPFGDATVLDPSVERGHPFLSTYLELKPKQERRLVLTVLEPPSSLPPLLPIQALPKRPTAHWSASEACPI